MRNTEGRYWKSGTGTIFPIFLRHIDPSTDISLDLPRFRAYDSPVENVRPEVALRIRRTAEG